MSSIIARIDSANALPAYRQIRNQIADFIARERLESGTRLPDIRSLSAQAGVSVRTVYCALEALIADGICYRRPKKGTFVAAGVSADPKQVSRKAICSFHTGHPPTPETNTVDSMILAGMRERSHDENADLLLLSGDNLAAYTKVPGLQIAGVILFAWRDMARGLALAATHPGLRFIFVNYRFEAFDAAPANVHGVFNDDRAGAHEATDALLRRGHRQIGALTIALEDSTYRDRLDGWRTALTGADAIVPESVTAAPSDTGRQSFRLAGGEAARELLRRNPGLTALFCVNDLLAAGAVDWLAKAGLRERVEVIGYDNILPAVSRDGDFSTVSVHFAAMGEKAVEMLQLPADQTPRVLQIAPTLIPRWRVPAVLQP